MSKYLRILKKKWIIYYGTNNTVQKMYKLFFSIFIAFSENKNVNNPDFSSA